jgi:hypothetical protein
MQVKCDYSIWTEWQRVAASGTGWHAMLMSSEMRSGRNDRCISRPTPTPRSRCCASVGVSRARTSRVAGSPGTA